MDKIISLLREIAEAIGKDKDPLHNDINLQQLVYDLYNDGAEDTEKGDIVKLQEDLNSRDYIIEEQVGSTGYRKWASGMLEQWGIATSVGAFSAYSSASMPVAFKDDTYCVVGSIREQMNGYMFIMPYDKQIIKFRVTASNGATIDAKISWKAEGYWK